VGVVRGRTRWSASGALAALGLTAVLSACSSPGDLMFLNDGDTDATVSTGDEEAVVSSDGAVVLLGYGCTPGDVTVVLGSGRTIVLPGPVCPDQEVVIEDDDARLRPVTASTT
jgi:hypothetical protein